MSGDAFFPSRHTTQTWAALAMLGAGLVHVAVVRGHLESSLLHGMFFAVLATLQIGWSVTSLARNRPATPRLMLAVTGGVLLLWVVSRLIPLPVVGAPEPVGTADLLVTILQLSAVAGVLLASRLPVASADHSRIRRLLPLAAGALLMSAITTPALAATEAGTFARPHHGGSHSTAP